MKPGDHVAVLDGWRGVSILLVLAAHLLPLGPRGWNLNVEVGVAGMVLFFVLSGFLITSILLKEVTIPEFLARRFFRVVPLAWLYLAVALAISGTPLAPWLAHYFFYANLPPQQLVPLTAHLWSVCVEMQFYVAIALLVSLLGTRGLMLLPVACIAFTGLRVWNDVYSSSITWFRIDELLSGCILALACHGRLGDAAVRFLGTTPQLPLVALLALSCIDVGWAPYFRPYLGALVIGATLLNPGTFLARALNVRGLAYVAAISYALYVLHPMLAATWLGSGDTLEKYLKRPLLFLALLAAAHLSTFHYEKHWIALGRRLGAGFARRRGPALPESRPGGGGS